MKSFKGFTFFLMALLLALSTNGLAQDEQQTQKEEQLQPRKRRQKQKPQKTQTHKKQQT